jgi:hypothetical protein
MSNENPQRLKPGESIGQYFERRKQYHTESNSTLQRRRMMTTDEKRQGAVEKMARDLKQSAERVGKEVTHESARREALRIAENAFKKVDR